MFRLRICHQKQGRLRFLSHLEMAGALERAVRRAGLPVALRGKYSPHLRLSFGPSLPVGVSSAHEYFDLFLTENLMEAEVLGRLQPELPTELAVLGAAYVPNRAPSLTELIDLAVYEVTVLSTAFISSSSAMPAKRESLRRKIESLVSGEVELARKGKKRQVSLAKAVDYWKLTKSTTSAVELELGLVLGGTDNIRPQEFVDLTFGHPSHPPRIHRKALYAKLEEDFLNPLFYVGVQGLRG